MKKTFLYFAVIFAAMFAGVSCEKIEQPVQVKENSQETIEAELLEGGDYVVKFSLSMADDQTKTGFDTGTGIEWKKGDNIRFYQVYYENESSNSPIAKPSDKAIGTNGDEAIFNCEFDEPFIDDNKPVRYFAVYPQSGFSANLSLSGTSSGIRIPRMTLPSDQTPSSNSFDPKSDILIGEHLTLSEKQATLKLRFERMCAIGKMKIVGITSSNNIQSIVFSAHKHKEDKDVILAGSTFYNFNESGYYQYDKNDFTGDNKKYNTEYFKEIKLNYSEAITANSEQGMTAYFCCYPFELGEGDSFKLVITTTAGEVFTRTVEIPTGRELKFERGKGTKFTVDMSGGEATVTVGETTTTYPTISAAFDAANDAASAATIKLMKNCTASAALTVDKENANITLDLNGYTLTEAYTNNTSRRVEVKNGSLTILSSRSTGTIYSKVLLALIDAQGGKINIDDSNVKIQNGYVPSSSSTPYLFKVANCELTISSGFFDTGTVGGLFNKVNTGTGNISVSGGYFSKEVTTSYLAEGKTCYQTNEYNDYPYAVLSTGVALFRAGTDKVESKTTINDAIDAANSATGKECTITLVDNCQVSGSTAVDVTNSAGVTLDLNGWTLTQNEKGRDGVASNGHLEITDNSKENTGVVQQLANSNITSYTISVSAGTLDITGGTIKQNTGEKGTYTVYVDGATLNVSGKANIEGDISIALYVNSGTVIISNGTFSSKLYTIGCMGDDSTITIHDGVFKNTNTSPTTVYYGSNIYAKNGSVTIDGGQFTSNRQTVYCDGDNVQITILEEPSFKNNYNEANQAQGAVVYAYGGKGNIKVNGGYFYTCCTNTSPLCFAGGASAFDITRAILNTLYATNYVNSDSNTSTVELYHYHGSEYLKYTRETKPITSN